MLTAIDGGQSADPDRQETLGCGKEKALHVDAPASRAKDKLKGADMLDDDGRKVAQFIIGLIKRKLIVLPSSISLKDIEEQCKVRPQNTGSAFSIIKKVLKENGVDSKKAGTPVRIMLSKA